jgi:hypothetical protein
MLYLVAAFISQHQDNSVPLFYPWPLRGGVSMYQIPVKVEDCPNAHLTFTETLSYRMTTA